MVQSAEDWRRDDAMTITNLMAGRARCDAIGRWIRNAWSQARVRAAAIVVSDRDIRLGDNWVALVEKAIADAGAFLALLTEVSAQSPTVSAEVQTALNRRPPPRVIPVRLEPCEFPPELRALQGIDLFEDGGWDGHALQPLGQAALALAQREHDRVLPLARRSSF